MSKVIFEEYGTGDDKRINCRCKGYLFGQIHQSDNSRWYIEFAKGIQISHGKTLRAVAKKLDKLNRTDKRIAELEESQRWIPVSERLPENGNHVPAFVNLEPFIAFHMSEFPRWISVLDYHFFDNENYEDITHWMPLPELPPEVQE